MTSQQWKDGGGGGGGGGGGSSAKKDREGGDVMSVTLLSPRRLLRVRFWGFVQKSSWLEKHSFISLN